MHLVLLHIVSFYQHILYQHILYIYEQMLFVREHVFASKDLIKSWKFHICDR